MLAVLCVGVTVNASSSDLLDNGESLPGLPPSCHSGGKPRHQASSLHRIQSATLPYMYNNYCYITLFSNGQFILH